MGAVQEKCPRNSTGRMSTVACVDTSTCLSLKITPHTDCKTGVRPRDIKATHNDLSGCISQSTFMKLQWAFPWCGFLNWSPFNNQRRNILARQTIAHRYQCPKKLSLNTCPYGRMCYVRIASIWYGMILYFVRQAPRLREKPYHLARHRFGVFVVPQEYPLHWISARNISTSQCISLK